MESDQGTGRAEGSGRHITFNIEKESAGLQATGGVVSQDVRGCEEKDIATSARRCLREFARLRRKLVPAQTATEFDRQASQLLSNASGTYVVDQEQISVAAFDDELGRFRLWGHNLGAFQYGRSSLDYRLKDVSFLRKNVLSLLEDLQDSLLMAFVWICKPKVADEDQQTEGSDDELSDSSRDSSDSDGDSEWPEGSRKPRSAVEEYFSVVVEVIDRLYKSSMAIRDPAVRTRSLKAATFVDKDELGYDRIAMFEVYAIAQATHQMKEWKQNWTLDPIDEDMAVRLGKANTRRRQQLLYEKRHAKKLAFAENLPVVFEFPAASSGEEVVSEELDLPSVDLNQPQSTTPITQTAGTIYSKTTATEYVARPPPRNKSKSLTSVSTTFSGYISHDVVVPLPPNHTVEKPFECPYCYMILPSSYKDDAAWRKHVMQDLQPYVCIFHPCEDNRLFENMSDWLQHQQWAHSLMWACNDGTHPHEVFESSHDFEQHLRETHKGAFDETQLPILVDAAKQPSATLFQSCPLCGWMPTTPDNGSRPGVGLPPRKEPKEELEKHVAAHLRQSAMVALPPLSDVGEDEDEGDDSTDSTSANMRSEVNIEEPKLPGFARDDTEAIHSYFDLDFEGYQNTSIQVIPNCEEPVAFKEIFGINRSEAEQSLDHLSAFAFKDSVSSGPSREESTSSMPTKDRRPLTAVARQKLVIAVLGAQGSDKTAIIRSLCQADSDVHKTNARAISSATQQIVCDRCGKPDHYGRHCFPLEVNLTWVPGATSDAISHEIRAYFYLTPNYEITFLDTPDITPLFHDEIFVLSKLAACLRADQSLYPLSGALYFHALHVPDIYCLPSYTLEMFRSLCGGDALWKMALVTTGWVSWDGESEDDIGNRAKEARIMRNEQTWAPLLRGGARVKRLRVVADSELETFMNDFALGLERPPGEGPN